MSSTNIFKWSKWPYYITKVKFYNNIYKFTSFSFMTTQNDYAINYQIQVTDWEAYLNYWIQYSRYNWTKSRFLARSRNHHAVVGLNYFKKYRYPFPHCWWRGKINSNKWGIPQKLFPSNFQNIKTCFLSSIFQCP